MREIKFRAWINRYEMMVDVEKISIISGRIYFDSNWWREFELMQYTGIKDKNGKEIYEGDIVINKCCGISNTSIVRFGNYKSSDMASSYECGHLGCYIEHPWDKLETIRKDILFYANQCEVIGNIFENPELLGVEDEKN